MQIQVYSSIKTYLYAKLWKQCVCRKVDSMSTSFKQHMRGMIMEGAVCKCCESSVEPMVD